MTDLHRKTYSRPGRRALRRLRLMARTLKPRGLWLPRAFDPAMPSNWRAPE